MDETYNGESFSENVLLFKTPTDREIRLVNAENRIVKLRMDHPHTNIFKYVDGNRNE